MRERGGVVDSPVAELNKREPVPEQGVRKNEAVYE